MKQLILSTSFLALFACSSDVSDLDGGNLNRPDAGPEDQGVTTDRPDSGTQTGRDIGASIDTGVSGDWAFEPQGITGDGVVFGDAKITDARIEVPLVGRGISRVNGLAFYIRYDADVLEFVRLTRRAEWTHDGGLWEVSEPEPGLVVVGISAIGVGAGIELDNVLFADLVFTRLREQETTIELSRGFMVDDQRFGKMIATESAELLWR